MKLTAFFRKILGLGNLADVPNPAQDGTLGQVQGDFFDRPAAVDKLPRGVSKSRHGFEARISRGGVHKSLGIFKDAQAASIAYQAAIASFALNGVLPGVSVQARRRSSRALPVGVSLEASGRYLARHRRDGKQVRVGLFDTPEAAAAALAEYRRTGVLPAPSPRVGAVRDLPRYVYRTKQGRFCVVVSGKGYGTFDSLEIATAVAAEAASRAGAVGVQAAASGSEG